MYTVGTKVVYSIHGVGKISDIEEKDILGERKQYYVVKLVNNNMKIMLPCDFTSRVKLRSIASNKEIDDTLSNLQHKTIKLDGNWRVRYNHNYEKIKTGSFLDLAEVVKDLSVRSKDSILSSSEKKLFHNALKSIIDEVSLSKDIENGEARNIINKTLLLEEENDIDCLTENETTIK